MTTASELLAKTEGDFSDRIKDSEASLEQAVLRAINVEIENKELNAN